MSINVTVSGNPINIRRGRVVLSDLDQIKKNERDRRRRLRLEQVCALKKNEILNLKVRQQSKEISSRLLERAKNIALQELEKLEKDEKSELKHLHDKKIMEIQQKYQEGLESIGQAHADAARETEELTAIKDETEKNRLAALKRGKEALQQLQRQDKDDLHAIHRQRLQQVRELENKRSSLVAELSKKSVNQDKADENLVQEDGTPIHEGDNLHKCTKKKKLKRLISKKSPAKITRGNEKLSPRKMHDEGCGKKCVSTNMHEEKSRGCTEETIRTDRTVQDDETPRETVPTLSTSTKAEKIARYNPGDYAQDSSDSMSNDSPSSLSDDSSYFSDVCDQSTCIRTPKHHTSLRDSKVQLYDHTTRQRNIYNRPLDVVERLDIRNEPNAVDAAREIQRTESMQSHVTENHKLASQKRGDDAILREKVRSDYKTLIQNLDHLASEERKLKASDIQTDPMNDVQLRKSRRKELQKEQKKKLNRAFEAIADKSCCSSHCPNLTERIITLAPLQQSEDHNEKPKGTWREPHFVDTHEPVIKSPKSKDISREELILDMLKKVERQKRLLLQEFGTSLPDDIFRASMTTLTEPEKSNAAQKKLNQQKHLSPEVTLINMSSGEDDTGSSKKPKKKSISKKCEMAVQTSILQDVGIAEDKGVQVELIEAKTDTNNGNKEISTESKVPSKHYPIEPKVTVINPEADGSSSSINSVVTGVIIDIDNEEVKVTPKKKKGVLKLSKRTSVRSTQKAHSAPPSKTSSPVKRFSKSLPSSCHSSPRKINIHVKRNGLDVKVDPPHDIKPVVDSSTDSSAMYSSINTQDSSVSKPYEVHAKSRRAIRIRETSDTSTSFASPPTLEPKRYINMASNITPILEMLDSSAYSSIERTKIDISPVSTPETPSPRTMMMPSNIPHAEKISKILRYGDSERKNDIRESISKKDAQTTFYQRRENISSGHRVYSHHSPILSKPCSCQNPNCKLLHVQLEDIQDFALKNCPEILKKYEDLQSMCTERIASLSDLIEKVRSEQRGMELSVMSPHDETSFMEIQPNVPNDLQSVQRLVENIEAIHKQLTKTLLESQKTTNNESINQDTLNDTQNQIKNSKNKSKLEHSVSTAIEHASDDIKTKTKPRIIKEEKVNVKLNRFKMAHKPSAIMTTVTPERNSWPPTKMSVHENNTIEELSKEILEQSKHLDKSTIAFKKIGDIKNKDVKVLLQKSDSSKPGSPSKSESNDVPMQNEYINLKSKKDVAFEPILAGIPKMLPTSTNGHRINGKNKPPVSLQSGFFRTEIDSMGHELSTIVEFDTPDTASKSYANIRNSMANSLVMEGSRTEKSAVKKSVEVQTTKSSVKPSIHVAPLPVPDSVDKRSSLGSPSTKKSPREMFSSKLQEVATECNLSRKTKGEMHLEYRTTDGTVGFVDCVKEKVNKQLQCNTSDPKTKHVEQASDKGKVSSTSSNSFYELSGISEITSTPPSSLFKYASSIEEIETELKKLHLNWGITLLKKTREASALSSSSNSDITPLNTARRMISPTKKHINSNIGNLLDFSDVSSISIKEASKSTEQAVLLKGRTSTPKLQNSNSNSDKTNSVASNSSGISFQEPSDSLTVPNVSLIKTKSNINQSKGL